jgi:tRNA G10  N-methylase Trm11
MIQTVCVLGRQPALGLAELESLYGTSKKIQPIGPQAVLVDIDPPLIDFSRLGGTVKFCKLLTILDSANWSEVESFLKNAVPEHLQHLPEGKLRLGLSVYGMGISVQRLNATGLEIKKVIKATGRSVRFVPNKELALNSAQVLHNKLTQTLGWELIFIRDGNRTFVAQNIAEQDIEAYTARDQARPKRDARVGMLPPKLAQIIVNLAVGEVDPADPTCGAGEPKGSTVLDPFCGTGVILQEALIMGYNAYGTDLEPRMVDYAKANLDWLGITSLERRIAQADATSSDWEEPFDMIAAETYLGRPFSSNPDPDVLEKVVQDVDTIHKKFLKNVARQTKAGFRLSLAVPAWKIQSGFRHLPILDHLEELGYTRAVFERVRNQELIYHRPEQIVGRELVVLIRK